VKSIAGSSRTIAVMSASNDGAYIPTACVAKVAQIHDFKLKLDAHQCVSKTPMGALCRPASLSNLGNCDDCAYSEFGKAKCRGYHPNERFADPAVLFIRKSLSDGMIFGVNWLQQCVQHGARMTPQLCGRSDEIADTHKQKRFKGCPAPWVSQDPRQCMYGSPNNWRTG
jgi:hypothetical protein